MTHTVEVVRYEKLSSGQFSVCFRCCGNPSTDSSHTMDAKVMADKKKRKESLDAARELVAKNHDAALKAEEAALELAGDKGKVDL